LSETFDQINLVWLPSTSDEDGTGSDLICERSEETFVLWMVLDTEEMLL
jgi:hypothetical protein